MKTDDDVAAGSVPAAKAENGETTPVDAAPAADSSEAAGPEKPTAEGESSAEVDATAEPADTDSGKTDVPEPADSVDSSEAESSEAESSEADSAGAEASEPTDSAESAEDGGVADAPPSPPAAPPAKGGIGGFLPPRTTKARVLVAVVLVLLFGAGYGAYWWFAERLPDGVAFRVDGVSVTEQQLEEQVQTLSALYGVQAPSAEDQPRLDRFRRDVAKSTAVSMAIDNAAVERNIAIADRQVADFLGRYIISQYGEGQAGREAYVKDLADKGTSEPKVLEEIKRQLALKQLFDQVTADVTVTDQDVRQAFDQRQAEFASPERREIHNIVTKTKAEADAVAAEVRAGGNLEALAGQKSIDGSSRENGGNLGLVTARDLQPGYAEAAFATPVGGIFGPVETQQPSGPVFNVGKVVQSQPGAPAEFDRIKDGVRRLLISERADAKWRAFTEEQIKKADIDYAAGYLPPDPDALPPASGAGGSPAPPK